MSDNTRMKFGRISPSSQKILKDGSVGNPRIILTKSLVALIVVKVHMHSPWPSIGVVSRDASTQGDKPSEPQLNTPVPL